jgi:hypothetical protein
MRGGEHLIAFESLPAKSKIKLMCLLVGAVVIPLCFEAWFSSGVAIVVTFLSYLFIGLPLFFKAVFRERPFQNQQPFAGANSHLPERRARPLPINPNLRR